MQKVIFALVVLCTLAVTLGAPQCSPDTCATVKCEAIVSCVNGQVIPRVGPCGCCSQCVQYASLRVGFGKRCGPPTYLSCDAGLVCVGSPGNGICQWP